jgi:signal transduction histidine kinase
MSDPLRGSLAAVSEIDAVPKILEVVCRATGMGFAAVARVTEDRWIACAVRDEIDFGLKAGGELAIATTICNEIRQTRQPVIIDHVAEDPCFRDHPTPKRYGFQSYISVPIIYEDRFFGTLCAIDPKPARLRGSAIPGIFELFADLIGAHLTARERLIASQADLMSAVETSELREQFIAILGHDLRNPLAALAGGVRALERSPSPEKTKSLLAHMRQSIDRAAGLIQDVMDFAKGRLGGGIEVRLQQTPPLLQALNEVVAEFQLAEPERLIVSAFDIDEAVTCDVARVSQLLSNLIGNALVHGPADKAVVISARTRGGYFELSVANAGAAIAPETQALLFRPFYRGRTGGEGLGLGLYIASEIARAHNGELSVASDTDETRFTFTMPLAVEAVAAREAAVAL